MIEKVLADGAGLQPAPHAEQAPCAHRRTRGWVGRARRIFAVRRSLLHGITGGDALTRLLPAVQAVVAGRRQPIGQDREGLPARMTDSASHPDPFVPFVVRSAEPPSVADDRVVAANRTSPREQFQRDHPGSMLSFASGSAIKRITAGVKAGR